MYCLFGTEDSRILLRGIHQEKIVSEKIGYFDSDTFLKICQQIANLGIDTLFLDMRCANDDAIIKGVRIIRFHRSNTRIVLIAPNREPGDPTISTLVSLGVYDIVSFDEEAVNEENVSEEIKNLLQRPPNYADAARWHFQMEEPVYQQRPARERNKRVQPPAPPLLEEFEVELPQTKPKIIERLVGTATIAVAGVTRRTGSTHLAVSLSTYLSRRKYDVAAVEISDYPVLELLREDKPAKIDCGFNREADFYPQGDDRLIHSVLSHSYQFVVLDLGHVTAESHSALPELGRSSVVFLTMGPSEWDFRFMVQTLDTFHHLGFGHQWNVIVNFADPETFRDIEQAFSPAEREKLKVRFFRNPVQSDPFRLHAEQESIFEECLSAIIPKKDRRRFKLF